MGNENHEKYLDFLMHYDAKELFGKLDYLLKKGVHIQEEHPMQNKFYHFLSNQKTFEGLKAYYEDFFGVILSKSRNDKGQVYFFLEFEKIGNMYSRGSIYKSDFLESDAIVVGILLYLMCCVGLYSEKVTSILTFRELLSTDYKDCEHHFYRLLSKNKAKTKLDTNLEEGELNGILKLAFNRFKELGWVYYEDENTFKVLPALNRLRDLYKSRIDTFEEYKLGYLAEKQRISNEE